jgi:hypothetical protein
LNKKGYYILSKEIPKMIFYAFFIVVLALVIVGIFGMFVIRKTNTADLENHLIVNRLLVSSNCLAYESNGRVFPGIIDLNKFDENNLKNCLDFSHGEKVGVKLDFYYFDGSLYESIELNDPIIARYPICGLKNSGVKCYFTRKYVLYNDFERGILDLVVVSKNG